jgi:hypothetical protein
MYNIRLPTQGQQGSLDEGQITASGNQLSDI